jgi:phosphoribosylaminoimidazolecarboxamide formyltransferase/IMP cyclohydrolase
VVVRHALLSVSDKAGIVPFAEGLRARGFQLVSTGGTEETLRAAGLPVRSVAELTGEPERFGGRVKTLHPRVHGGILARRGVDDAACAALGQPWIDVVVVNLYPFGATVDAGASPDDCVEQIDIGGPALLRAAAKNHRATWAVVEPSDYDAVLAGLDNDDAALRGALAARAFRHVASYDARVAAWLTATYAPADVAPAWPETLPVPLGRVAALRYGENPHQRAAFYAVPGEGGRSLARVRALQGKLLSFNNLADLDAATRLAFAFREPSAVIVKHQVPCGVATHPEDVGRALALAWSADPRSAYGGVVVLNRALDAAALAALVGTKGFLEVVAAPGIHDDARTRLASRANLRLVDIPGDWAESSTAGFDARRVQGGWLVQDWDSDDDVAWTHVGRPPNSDEDALLRFAWTVVGAVKSNAIVLARADAEGARVTNGIGSGQVNRVDAVRHAVARAVGPLHGSVLASDAFFPFADGVQVALEAGVRAFAQPGGSVRDDEVCGAVVDARGTMVLTGRRRFRH